MTRSSRCHHPTTYRPLCVMDSAAYARRFLVLNTCRKRSRRLDWYPTRLIERHGLGYRLVQGKSLPPGLLYMTLSHRWGTATDIARLTAQAVPTWKKAIPAQALSQTFKDALEVAYRLGVPYVWIDSLCIIQEGDGGKDWAQEAPIMHASRSCLASPSSQHHVFQSQSAPLSCRCRSKSKPWKARSIHQCSHST